MDNLLINLIGMGNQVGTTGSTPLKESGGTETNQKDFLKILTNILSGSNNQESLLKQLKEIHQSGEPGIVNVMSAISNMLLSMMPQDGKGKLPEGTEQKVPDTAKPESAREVLPGTGAQKEIKDLSGWLEQMNYAVLQGMLANVKSGEPGGTSADELLTGAATGNEAGVENVKAFQEEMTKLLSSLELTIDKNKSSSLDKAGNMPVQAGAALNLQQALLNEGKNAETDLIQAQNGPVTTELFTKDILEKNAVLLRTILENGGKANREDNNKNNSTGGNKGLDGLLKPGETRAQSIVNPSFVAEQELDDGGGNESGADAQTLIQNAAKKYKEHISETGETKVNVEPEITHVSSQKTNSEVPQAESFRSNVFQVKDNNMTFEKGSFTSFVTDRIEKIVEQFSARTSQMDMVVRLKLDDTETLLVGLRHEGQKVIVDVKASNDGLASLLQAHKDDIARHLEDKNIFTSIFVQPDGEKNFQRQNQREQNKDDRRQEAGVSFTNIMEATA